METLLFKALVDSSSQTLVRSECLGESNVLNHDKLRVCCIHGDEKEYPKIEIVIEIEGQAYRLSVGVIDKSPYPVILGRDVPVLVDLLQRDNVADVGLSQEHRLIKRRSVNSFCKIYHSM